MKAILIQPSQPPARPKKEKRQKPLQKGTKGLTSVEGLKRLCLAVLLLLWQIQRKGRLLSQAPRALRCSVPASPYPLRGERLCNLRSLLLELFHLTRPQRKTRRKAQQRQRKPSKKAAPKSAKKSKQAHGEDAPKHRGKKSMKEPVHPCEETDWQKSQRFCQSAKGIAINAKTIRKMSWLWLRTMTRTFRSLSTGAGLLLD